MGILSGCMRWVCLILVCGCVLLSFAGCGGRVSALPDRLGKAFCATLVWERGGVLLRGELVADRRGESGTREMTLRLSAPDALAGICARQTEEGITMTLDGEPSEAIPADGLMLPALLLTAEGVLTDLCNVEEGGRRLRLAEGTYGGERTAYYFSLPEGIPVRLVWGELSVEILNFKERS